MLSHSDAYTHTHTLTRSSEIKAAVKVKPDESSLKAAEASTQKAEEVDVEVWKEVEKEMNGTEKTRWEKEKIVGGFPFVK